MKPRNSVLVLSRNQTKHRQRRFRTNALRAKQVPGFTLMRCRQASGSSASMKSPQNNHASLWWGVAVW